MRVVLFMRRPRAGSNFSVERMVDSITQHVSPEFRVTRLVSRFESNGVLRRMVNILEASCHQGDVNHVTGDVNFLAYLLNRDKTLLTVLDCARILGKPTWRKRLIRLLWFRIPARRAAVITTISHAAREDLLHHVQIDPGRVHVVYVPVPLWSSLPKTSFNARKPNILQVGTGKNKNIERLCEALKGIPCILHIVGKLDDAQRTALATFGIEHRNYMNLSNEQLLARYEDADIVAFVSTMEGFGMPIVEGNMVGRPVVTSNVASMPEVAGDAACLVDPFDVPSIRAGLKHVIEDAAYRNALVAKGFVNARRFDPAAIARQYEALYRKLGARTEDM